MSENSAVSRIARKAILELQSEFETLAPKFLKLKHLYIAYSEVSELPFHTAIANRFDPPHGLGPCASSYVAFHDGRWVNLFAIGESTVKVWESWYEGDGKHEFDALAERAGAQLESFRIRVPPPEECLALLRRHPAFAVDHPPVLPYQVHRWVIVLHWLAWAGKAMPVGRNGVWHGMNVPFDNWDESQFGPRPPAFCSVIDNVFVRSFAAIDWMIAGLDEPAIRADDAHEPDTTRSKPPATHRSRNVGRPLDTDVMKDRSIATAWNTGRYETYDELAVAIGKKKDEVKKALDRHRHRVGKSESGKSGQATDKHR